MILGIVGKARQGKDTFTIYLVDVLHTIMDDISLSIIAFADELKLMCMKHFDLVPDQLWGSGKEVGDERYIKYDGGLWTPREIMQVFGEFYRSIDNDYWVNIVNKKMSKDPDSNYIITDVRHKNEFDFVKQKNGVLIKVVRKDSTEIHGMDHISETALDDMPDDYFDIIINNDGTLEDLQNAAKETVGVLSKIEKLKSMGVKLDG